MALWAAMAHSLGTTELDFWSTNLSSVQAREAQDALVLAVAQVP